MKQKILILFGVLLIIIALFVTDIISVRDLKIVFKGFMRFLDSLDPAFKELINQTSKDGNNIIKDAKETVKNAE